MQLTISRNYTHLLNLGFSWTHVLWDSLMPVQPENWHHKNYGTKNSLEKPNVAKLFPNSKFNVPSKHALKLFKIPSEICVWMYIYWTFFLCNYLQHFSRVILKTLLTEPVTDFFFPVKVKLRKYLLCYAFDVQSFLEPGLIGTNFIFSQISAFLHQSFPGKCNGNTFYLL